MMWIKRSLGPFKVYCLLTIKTAKVISSSRERYTGDRDYAGPLYLGEVFILFKAYQLSGSLCCRAKIFSGSRRIFLVETHT